VALVRVTDTMAIQRPDRVPINCFGGAITPLL